MTRRMYAVSALPAADGRGGNCALVQFAEIVDGELVGVPGLVQYPLEIEGEVCGKSIEEAVYRLLDELNGKGRADGDE